MNKQKGFTLIELLVVIAIISVLASIVFVNVSAARSKARDVARMEALKNLQKALELYYQDNGSYPTFEDGWNEEAIDPINYIPGLAPTYISSLPTDPLGGGFSAFATNNSFCGFRAEYAYQSAGTGYKILSYCAPENDWTGNPLYDDTSGYRISFYVCVDGDESACSF